MGGACAMTSGRKPGALPLIIVSRTPPPQYAFSNEHRAHSGSQGDQIWVNIIHLLSFGPLSPPPACTLSVVFIPLLRRPRHRLPSLSIWTVRGYLLLHVGGD
eukprot:GEMP01097123.1.p2 GENE.GEMP01097123.1~~GEMP01097123.1.p2  ORF type:complete len:102 (-),score=5.28 GEMP01097123.1:406-711(-)